MMKMEENLIKKASDSVKITGFLLAFLFMNVVVLSKARPAPKHYNLYIYNVNITKLCKTTATLTANGTFPGPTIYAEKGETIFVTIHNNGTYGITIHWHGVRQLRNPWSDGPMNITQCSIPPGSSFRQMIIFSEEEGTLWYHAHSEWSMTTVHGAIVVYPLNRIYPYPKKHDREQTIVLSTWFMEEVMKVYKYIKANHLLFPRANGTTINGEPGYPNNCSAATSFRMTVEHGKTYLLRVVNAIINEVQFFGIAGHKLTLVGHDGSYTEPLTSDYILIAPGQTMDVLFTANQAPDYYYMAAAPYFVGAYLPGLTNTTTSAILRYKYIHRLTLDHSEIPFPNLPALTDTSAASNFSNAIRSSNRINRIVPKYVDRNITIRAAFGKIDGIIVSALNNISFVYPNVSILEAYSRNMSGYFDVDFPIKEEDIPAATVYGTKVVMFNYSEAVQVVFESTDVHPMHTHGINFYVVASGQGKFKDVEGKITICTESMDPTMPCYNFVDPPKLSTVAIPVGGWVAVRFIADNPGVWFVHCHFERHLTSGMSTVFIVKNGTTDEQRMLPPPNDMPPCACDTETPHLSSISSEWGSFFKVFAFIGLLVGFFFTTLVNRSRLAEVVEYVRGLQTNVHRQCNNAQRGVYQNPNLGEVHEENSDKEGEAEYVCDSSGIGETTQEEIQLAERSTQGKHTMVVDNEVSKEGVNLEEDIDRGVVVKGDVASVMVRRRSFSTPRADD